MLTPIPGIVLATGHFTDSLLAGKAHPSPQTHRWQALPGIWRINARRYHGDRIHLVSVILRLMQINLYLDAMAQDRAHH